MCIVPAAVQHFIAWMSYDIELKASIFGRVGSSQLLIVAREAETSASQPDLCALPDAFPRRAQRGRVSGSGEGFPGCPADPSALSWHHVWGQPPLILADPEWHPSDPKGTFILQFFVEYGPFGK